MHDENHKYYSVCFCFDYLFSFHFKINKKKKKEERTKKIVIIMNKKVIIILFFIFKISRYLFYFYLFFSFRFGNLML